jgi:hypothetical protein
MIALRDYCGALIARDMIHPDLINYEQIKIATGPTSSATAHCRALLQKLKTPQNKKTTNRL